jgi:DtxR family Mn-dependent transcriptional regulator
MTNTTSDRGPAPISASVEDYLKAIYRLTPSGKPVGPSRLAEHMGLSAPSISIMVRRLAEQGLVVKDNGKGVALTETGAARALEVLRKHRLSECFLVSVLGLDWKRAHEEAHRFEHALSNEVADALERFLEFPTTCPHGNPIPDRGGVLRTPATVPLSSVTPDSVARLLSIDEEPVDLLPWLQDVGLVPGAQLFIEQADPYGKSLLVRIGERRVALGVDVADRIHVQIVEIA